MSRGTSNPGQGWGTKTLIAEKMEVSGQEEIDETMGLPSLVEQIEQNSRSRLQKEIC